MMSSALRAFQNPRKWRFTWEAMSHKPILKLFLFDSHTRPLEQCKNLSAALDLERLLLLVSWSQDVRLSLQVPIPRVLVDTESPVSFRALEDHIEISLLLLLPVNHPIVSGFDSLLNECQDNYKHEGAFSKQAGALLRDYDFGSTSLKEGVQLYCRNCSAKLTRRPLRISSKMPSVNWREAADNWFGACCCSFGAVSEKLVSRYANLYKCKEGTCLLNPSSVVLCKSDLLGFQCTDWDINAKDECTPFDNDPAGAEHDSGKDHGGLVSCENPRSNLHNVVSEESSFIHFHNESFEVNSTDKMIEKEACFDNSCHGSTAVSGCCTDISNLVPHCNGKMCTHDDVAASLENQKYFLSGFLEIVFMARSSNISENVMWIEFPCPQCSWVLGAFPFIKGNDSFDGGVQLFKCNISSCCPVGGSDDMFRMYKLERMFANQLVESADDELSFRTVISDLQCKRHMIYVVLLNADSWCCSGYCLCTDSSKNTVPVLEMHMQPVIKVLFGNYCNTDSQSRLMKEWVTRNVADEVYMFENQIQLLVASLESAKDAYPPSFVFQQGLCLSHIQR